MWSSWEPQEEGTLFYTKTRRLREEGTGWRPPDPQVGAAGLNPHPSNSQPLGCPHQHDASGRLQSPPSVSPAAPLNRADLISGEHTALFSASLCGALVLKAWNWYLELPWKMKVGKGLEGNFHSNYFSNYHHEYSFNSVKIMGNSLLSSKQTKFLEQCHGTGRGAGHLFPVSVSRTVTYFSAYEITWFISPFFHDTLRRLCCYGNFNS